MSEGVCIIRFGKGVLAVPTEPRQLSFIRVRHSRGITPIQACSNGCKKRSDPFSRYHDELLNPQLHKDTLVYLDDVLSYARTPEELASAIDTMLTEMAA